MPPEYVPSQDLSSAVQFERSLSIESDRANVSSTPKNNLVSRSGTVGFKSGAIGDASDADEARDATLERTDLDPAFLEHQYRAVCYQALNSQIKAAAATGAFTSPQGLPTNNGQSSMATVLSLYLRDECRAKFVDLSSFADWKRAAIALADAVRCGLRASRWLTLDGNDIGSDPEVLEAWCVALEEHPGLQHVSLRNTGITDEGARRLAKVLRGHPVLFSLDIGLNRIGMIGAVALEDALCDNDVLLEVNCEECDLSVEMQSALSVALQRNRDRFQRPGGALKALQNLKRSRAEAVTASAAFSAKVLQQCGKSQAPLSSDESASDVLLAMYAALDPAEVPFVYDEGATVEDEADGIFFDAGAGASIELNNRCDAAWRYSAADHEVLCELRRRTMDLKASRKHDKQRGEETLERMANRQCEFREMEMPVEERLAELREELAALHQASDSVQKVCLQQKIMLKREEEELEDICHERDIYKQGALQLESSLKLRNQEVQSEVEHLQTKLQEVEAATEALAADNKRYRSWLHAARFETEAERFAPRSGVQPAQIGTQ